MAEETLAFKATLDTSPLRREAQRLAKDLEGAMFPERNLGSRSGVTQQQLDEADQAFTKASRTIRNSMLGFGLSTMFFGMQLQRAAEGFLKPAGDAVGIFEIFTTTLELLFLPIMLTILPIFIWFLDVVAGLPDEVKLLAGGLVLLAFGLGSVMTVGGQLITLIAGLTGAEATIVGLTTALGGGAAGGGLLAAVSGLLVPLAVLTAIMFAAAAAGALLEPPEGVTKNEAETWVAQSIPFFGELASDLATWTRLGIANIQDKTGLTPSYPNLLEDQIAATGGFDINPEDMMSSETPLETKEQGIAAAIAAMNGNTNNTTNMSVQNLNMTVAGGTSSASMTQEEATRVLNQYGGD